MTSASSDQNQRYVTELHRLRQRMHMHPLGTHRSAAEVDQDHLTRGQRMADQITTILGSWRFIIIQSFVLIIWLALNSIAWALRWDPYPFILLNLALSFQAAFTAPIIMMSQNRQTSRDRIASELDFEVNRTSEAVVNDIQQKLDVLLSQELSNMASDLGEHTMILQELYERTNRIESLILALRDSEHPV